MSDASTSHLIEAYMEEAPAPRFLSGFFQSPRQNFHNSEKVELDIIRDDEDVAVVVTSMSASGHLNEETLWSNKAFTPPVFKEEAVLDGFKLITRNPGENPYVSPDYQANGIQRAFRVFRKMDLKLLRARELMASQVLQTGTLTLNDADGNLKYSLDFGMKGTHIVASSPTWSASLSTKDPLTQIEALARIVRRDGKKSPDHLIFGYTAWQNFIYNTFVQSLYDNRRIDVGGLGTVSMDRAVAAPSVRGEGANFEGLLTINGYSFDLWTYEGEYKDPATDTLTPYVTATNVIMKSYQSRLDMSYGNFPLPVPPEARALPFMPGRMNSEARGLDVITNAYIANDNTGVVVGAYSRPLTIPTAIDTLGVIKTQG